MIKTISAAVLLASQAHACDIVCAAIYSVDTDACACVPITMMECHPQYNSGLVSCNQEMYDEAAGRDTSLGYIGETWYWDSLALNCSGYQTACDSSIFAIPSGAVGNAILATSSLFFASAMIL